MPTTNEPTIHVTLSGDIFLKSRRTQRGLIHRVRANLTKALRSAGYEGRMTRIGTHRFVLRPTPDCREAVVESVLRVFGVASVDTVVEIPYQGMNDLAGSIAELAAERVRDRTFAVRVKRRGEHTWQSVDLAAAVGTLLVDAGGTVDLSNPEQTVSVTVLDDAAFLVSEHRSAQGGLPIGTQDPVLSLVSGGFDSVVAAWMMMSRGCPVDFVHFSLNCAQSDHALAVTRELWSSWGHGSDPTVHLVEFQPVKDALFEYVEPRMRQVTLKVMMAKAASQIAEEERISAMVTGDALGQVSSQTLPHLVAVSSAVSTPMLRPLVGLPKESIIDLARTVGTAELSARAQEVCDLSEGHPVATSAGRAQIDESVDAIPELLMKEAVTTRKMFRLSTWTPGQF